MIKPKPGPIFDKRTGRYRLQFSFRGKQFRRFYLYERDTACILQAEINQMVYMIKNGYREIPAGISLPDFIFGSIELPDSECTPEIEIPEDPMTAPKLMDWMETYEAEVLPISKKEKTSKQSEIIHLRHMRKFIAEKNFTRILLPDIKVNFFNQYKSYRYLKGVRTDTVNRELVTFALLFKEAKNRGYVDHNIVKDVERDGTEIPDDRFRTHSEIQKIVNCEQYTKEEIKQLRRFQYLTVPEIEKLIDLAEGKWIQPILLVYAYIGMRRGELPKLEWLDVDLESRFLMVRSKKQSRHKRESMRRVPIHKRIMPVLEEQQKKTGNARWVFLGPDRKQLKITTVHIIFRRMVRGTEFEGLGYHVFRHSFASNLAARGVEQHYIDGILGHQTEAMRRRYKHLFPKQLEEAINKIQTL